LNGTSSHSLGTTSLTQSHPGMASNLQVFEQSSSLRDDGVVDSGSSAPVARVRQVEVVHRGEAVVISEHENLEV
jgi:hypothetical protein